MNTDLLLRLAWALAIMALGAALYWTTSRLVLARARSGAARFEQLSGTPTILYFTTPTCAPCKTVQRPAIRQVQERLGERVAVVEVDAADRPDLANQWGVLSVPTTFIIDAQGQPRHVNHGVATVEKLLKQLNDLN